MGNLQKLMKIIKSQEVVTSNMIEEMQKNVEEFSVDCCMAIIQNKQGELANKLNVAKRLQRTMKKSINGRREELVYNMGVFSGVLKEAKLIARPLADKECFDEAMNRLFRRKYVPEILNFLLMHSDVQHKDIARAVNIKTNYASELLNELVSVGCIRKVELGKYRIYDLTMDGRRFAKKYVGGKEREDYRDFMTEYMQLENSNVDIDWLLALRTSSENANSLCSDFALRQKDHYIMSVLELQKKKLGDSDKKNVYISGQWRLNEKETRQPYKIEDNEWSVPLRNYRKRIATLVNDMDSKEAKCYKTQLIQHQKKSGKYVHRRGINTKLAQCNTEYEEINQNNRLESLLCTGGESIWKK